MLGKNYSADLKAKAVLGMLKERETANEIAQGADGGRATARRESSVPSYPSRRPSRAVAHRAIR